VGPPGALDRALALLDPSARMAVGMAPEGYLDALGGSTPASTGRTQDLMLSAAVPAVYERWWRPAWGRLAVGAFGPSPAQEHRLAEQLLELRPGDGVLDVACGPGNFTRGFGRAVGPAGLALGVAASPSMLRRAVHDTPEAVRDTVGFLAADATALPFRDASFDAVCCFLALHLMGDPGKALDEMVRVLTPGGRLALFTTSGLRSVPGRLLGGLVARQAGMRVFDRDEVAAGVRRRGLTDVTVRTTGLTQYVAGRRS
jgi:SAM-dependent methyltransferase